MSGSFWDQLEANRNASISVFHQYIRHANVMWRRITLLPAVAVVKGTVVPLNSVEAYWAAEAEVYAFWTSAQVGASHTGLFSPGERLPSIPLSRRLGGLHGRHGLFGGKKNYLMTLSGNEPPFVVVQLRAWHSHSDYSI